MSRGRVKLPGGRSVVIRDALRKMRDSIPGNAYNVLSQEVDFNYSVAARRFSNLQFTIKEGITLPFDSIDVPIDVHGGLGLYTGFPDTEQGEAQLNVSGTDTGTVWYAYLETPTSTEYVFASMAISGSGTYNLGHNVWRCNFMYFDGDNNAFNTDVITLRDLLDPSIIYCEIPADLGQSMNAAYSVPVGSSVYIDNLIATVRGAQTTARLDGFFYYKVWDVGARLRFPFEAGASHFYFDSTDFAVRIPGGVDIIPRFTYASANNSIGRITYRILKQLGE